jgi:hypothetical protein
MMNNKFVAFSIGRRSIAAAIFSGTKLEFWQTRSFQASTERANNTVTAFLNWIVVAFEIESAGLEDVPPELQTRMAALSGLAESLLRKHGIPVLKACEAELLSAYGEPPLRSRVELRRRAVVMFPELNSPAAQKELLDASILGLYIQTERLLSAAEQGSA